MLYNPTKRTKKENKILLLKGILFGFFVLFLPLHLWKIQTQVNVKKETFSGIIVYHKYTGGRGGYDYYTDKGNVIMSYYLLPNYQKVELNIGDSVYKAPNSFRLYIYKKDSLGNYRFDRKEMKHTDTTSPYYAL